MHSSTVDEQIHCGQRRTAADVHFTLHVRWSQGIRMHEGGKNPQTRTNTKSAGVHVENAKHERPDVCHTTAAHCALSSSFPFGFTLITPSCLDLFPSMHPTSSETVTLWPHSALVSPYISCPPHFHWTCLLLLLLLLLLTCIKVSRGKTTVCRPVIWALSPFLDFFFLHISDFSTESFVRGFWTTASVKCLACQFKMQQSPHCFFWTPHFLLGIHSVDHICIWCKHNTAVWIAISFWSLSTGRAGKQMGCFQIDTDKHYSPIKAMI